MVANYAPHHLLRFGGAYGAETWSCGLRMAVSGKRPTESDYEVAQLLLPSRAGAVRKWWAGVKSYVATGVTLSWVSLNHIGNDGKYSSDQTNEEFFTPIQGQAPSGTFHGPDVAVAATLLSSADRGYASKGRIYLPCNSGLSMTTSAGATFGQISTAATNAIGTATAALITDLNNNEYVFGGEVYPPVTFFVPRVGIFSPGTGKKQPAGEQGAWRPVVGVRVGGQPDTQRRRINKSPDLWSSGSVTFDVSS